MSVESQATVWITGAAGRMGRAPLAAELLLTTDQTVTYIAMEVGYANVKTFNRNFLRFKVMTPGDFRKKVALQESRL